MVDSFFHQKLSKFNFNYFALFRMILNNKNLFLLISKFRIANYIKFNSLYQLMVRNSTN